MIGLNWLNYFYRIRGVGLAIEFGSVLLRGRFVVESSQQRIFQRGSSPYQLVHLTENESRYPCYPPGIWRNHKKPQNGNFERCDLRCSLGEIPEVHRRAMFLPCLSRKSYSQAFLAERLTPCGICHRSTVWWVENAGKMLAKLLKSAKRGTSNKWQHNWEKNTKAKTQHSCNPLRLRF